MDNLCHEKLALEGVGEGLSGDGRPQDEEGGARVTNKKNRLGCKRKRAFSCPLHASPTPLPAPFNLSLFSPFASLCHAFVTLFALFRRTSTLKLPRALNITYHSLVSFYHSLIRTRNLLYDAHP